ncbi:ribonuclease T2 family protein [Solimonas terrae]|uniref:Ribonuclease T(2) n=1 Tax=Solimonas terrae TaxID=1396819 RepID=A0A6M2BN38_9GAMM|nr:ribonuclease T(2) [Solimonas terrae]NGY03443.1 ribonuclease T(2) [Solimonas terrae]
MRTLGFAAAALCALLCSPGAPAGGTPGQFDYWVLTLSWSPEYCTADIGDEQCPKHLDFVVQGLQPQNELGRSPSSCGDRTRVPKDLLVRMLPMMASEKLIQHEWNTHGSCSGLDQQNYFELVERARRKLEIPGAYDAPEQRIETSRDAVLQAFKSTNPDFTGEDFALDCRGHWLDEIHVCFDRDLDPRACASNVENDCGNKVMVRSNR